MSTSPSTDAPREVSPLKRALIAIDTLESRIRDLEGVRSEPIAIVGVGCRLPGGIASLEAFEHLLHEGIDAVSAAPPSRPGWLEDPDGHFPPAGYLEGDVGGFDPGLFGISPREAASIDPQQRLALECAWEALEHAGIDPRGLRGSPTGAFIGITGSDYANRQLAAPNARALLHAHFASGIAHSMASGRLAYLLGLQGPAISVDTACSSSLVAVHLACQALRNGECDLALAGGTNLILSPDFTVAFQESRMLSPDGRCKAFDARADGFSRGEGCAVIVLKRLSEAERDGDLILALIRSSAVNQDGPSSGLTAPSGPAQEAVIRSALARGGLKPGDIHGVEAHGTGTELGDPIEAQALGAVFRAGRPPERPLLVGSVKTNLGHLEACAGLAGLLKAALTVRSGEFPAHLHFEEPSPHIPWARLPLRVAKERTRLSEEVRPYRVGVSSFGFSGTNCHVVLEEAPAPSAPSHSPAAPERKVHLLPLSAASPAALADLSRRSADAVEAHAGFEAFADLCHTAGVGRAHLADRVAVTASSAEEAAALLRAFARGEPSEDRRLRSGRTPPDPVRPVFLFTGQGAQRPGMGKRLFETEPVFRATFERCARILRRQSGLDLMDLVFAEGPGAAAALDRTGHAQPALVSLEVALAELWRSWGVHPSMVIGHSVGEYSAAIVAGALTLEDGLALIAERARLMDALPEGGGMAAIPASEVTVEALLGLESTGLGEGLALAAVNGPASVVISGSNGAIDDAMATLADQGVEARRLRVSHAFHSPLMDPVLDALTRAAEGIGVQEPRIPLLSNRTGRPLTAGELIPSYWADHTRRAVRFLDCLQYARSREHSVFLECGPASTLCGIGALALPDGDLRWIPSLRKDGEDDREFAGAAAALYCAGVNPDWAGRDEPWHRRRVRLPTYPFQRESLWVELSPGRAGSASPSRTPEDHPLLGERLRSPEPGWRWESTLGATTIPFLADHVVDGHVVLPATAYFEMALAGAAAGPRWAGAALSDLSILSPLFLSDTRPRAIRLTILPPVEGTASVQIHSIGAGESDFSLHFEATLARDGADDVVPGLLDEPEVLAGCPSTVDPGPFYARLKERGLDFGPSFLGVRSIRHGPDEALGRIEPAANGDAGRVYGVHPALLDAGIQVIASVVGSEAGSEGTSPSLFLPVAANRVLLLPDAGPPVTSHVRMEGGPGGGGPAHTAVASLRMYDGEGRLTVVIDRLVLKRREATLRPDATDGAIYEVVWEAAPAPLPPEGSEVDAPSFLPDPEELALALEAPAASLAREHGTEAYDALYRDLDILCAEYVVEALRELGWSWGAGERLSLDDLMSGLRILPRHRRLVRAFLGVLGEEGMVRPMEAPELWEVLRPLPPVAPAELASRFAEEHGELDAELEVTRRCGEGLAGVLLGTQDPLELLFPGGDTSGLTRLYRDSPMARTLNALIREAVVQVTASLPAGRPLRVLEVGGGTGGTTSHVLPALQEGRSEYSFTDIGALFVARAREAFGHLPGMRFSTLDIDRDPAPQGFPPGTFDLVLASNVLHASRDLGASLRRVRGLLAPGGLLCALEVLQPARWMDLTVGLLEGWWGFTDTELRPDHALLGRDAWTQVLSATGFDGTAIFPPRTGSSVLSQQGIVLARSGSGPAGGRSVPIDRSRWLVLADRGGVAGGVGRVLGEQGATVFLVRGGVGVGAGAGEGAAPDPHSALVPSTPEGIDSLFTELLPAHLPHPTDVAFLWPLDEPVGAPATPATVNRELADWGAAALRLIQRLIEGSGPPPRLHLITRGAQLADTSRQSLSPSQATLWGLARAVRAERPELEVRCIDLPSHTEVDTLVAELLLRQGEPEVALRPGGRRVPRLHVVPDRGAAEDGPRRLVYGASGVLDDMEFVPWPRREPDPGEVEIEIEAAGLNFRDVVQALGVRSDVEALGAECVGVVRALGPGVRDLREGDRVLAAGGGFGNFVTLAAGLAVRVPGNLSIAQAATLPIAFLTADVALSDFGEMHRGQSILIHAAAGGVGMAALQLALAAGLEVYATAGSEVKRKLALELGARAVFDSRSQTFSRALLETRGGRGVDLVLNSLAGEFIPASLEVLAEGGRLLELGKTGIWTQEQVDGFEGARAGVTYHAVDLTQMLQERPDLIQERLASLVGRVERGELHPLPLRTFPMTRAVEAFRQMSAGRHIGKLVLVREHRLPIRGDGTYLVTGGLAGLGLLVAERLAERGAGHLLLLGRSGPSTEASRVLERIRAGGTPVDIVLVDVADPDAIVHALEGLSPEAPPVRGVVHSAGTLDDALLPEMTWERFRTVNASKVLGSLALTGATEGMPLDFLVLFSSIASVFGSPGQANHAAANAFMDTLAAELTERGRPALSIAWGAWGEVGAAARHGATHRISQRGIRLIEPLRGLELFEHLTASRTGMVVASPMDWEAFRAAGRRDWPLLERLKSPAADRAARQGPAQEARGAGAPATGALAARVAQAPARRRKATVRQGLEERVRRVLGLGAGHPIEGRQPLGELGLDSLLAVELRNSLADAVGRPLPATLLFDYPSVDALVEHFVQTVLALEKPEGRGEGDGRSVEGTDEARRAGEEVPRGGDVLSILDMIEELSDDEVEKRMSSGPERGHE